MSRPSLARSQNLTVMLKIASDADIDSCQWFQASSLDARTPKTKATISRMMARIAIPHDQLRSEPKNDTIIDLNEEES